MIIFPESKINLGLQVIAKRKDGLHEIKTIMYPLAYPFDSLEIVKSENEYNSISIHGFRTPTDNKNLILKFIDFMQFKFNLPKLHIHLIKNIPLGSGLGGASSNVGSTMILLNKLFQLNLSITQLEEIVAQFGNDCPFFIKKKVAIASETGSRLEQISLNLSSYYIKIVYPGFESSTSEAYKQVVSRYSSFELQTLSEDNIRDWNKYLKNDFEQLLFDRYPILETLKKQIYQSGAIYSSLSGSGSALYGIYEQMPQKLQLEKGMLQWDSKMI